MISQHDIDTILSGRSHVLDSNGAKVGSVGQVYLDDQSGDPSWVTVKTGLFGTSESFAPLRGANVTGDDVTIGYTKDQVKNAPRIESDGDLSPEEEDQLYRHYELSNPSTTTDTTTAGRTSGYESGFQAGDERVDRSNEAGTVGRDTSGPTTDTAMTRSEEQLRVGVERRQAGTARLRKYVVTENVTTTVPVSHEEVHIVREPITNANAHQGIVIEEDAIEVTLTEERPVIEKETVAVERIRLDKETVTEQQTVTEEVRKEQIEILDADGSNITNGTNDGTGRRH